MARVVLPRVLAERVGSPLEQQIEAKDVRALLRALEERYPGIRADLDEQLTVAIDGEILSDPLLEPLEEGSEVHFVPRLSGG